MSSVRFIVVPYDSGVRGYRMGAGPRRLVDAGLADHMRARGHDVVIEEIDAGAVLPEIAGAFTLAGKVARAAAGARRGGALPVVLSGNCIASLGAVAALQDDKPAVLWFDAHADFNTPETTISGFLDGMALSIITGDSWQPMAQRVHGFTPIAKQDVVLAGVRDVDPDEQRRLTDASLPVVTPRDTEVRLSAALEDVRRRTPNVYVHLDLDVLDPSEAPANHFAVADGLSVDTLCTVLAAVRQQFQVCGVALTAYDPLVDPQSSMPRAAARILDAIVTNASVAAE